MYTNVLTSLPSLTTHVSAVRFGLFAVHCASADVSIFWASGTAPVKATVPEIVPSSPFDVYAVPVSVPVSPSPPPLLHEEPSDSRPSVAINPSHTPARLLNIIDSSKLKLI